MSSSCKVSYGATCACERERVGVGGWVGGWARLGPRSHPGCTSPPGPAAHRWAGSALQLPARIVPRHTYTGPTLTTHKPPTHQTTLNLPEEEDEASEGRYLVLGGYGGVGLVGGGGVKGGEASIVVQNIVDLRVVSDKLEPAERCSVSPLGACQLQPGRGDGDGAPDA